MRRHVRGAPLELRLLLALAALLAVAWSIAQAPLTGPDETGHVAYVQRLAESGHAPQADSGQRTASTELSEVLSRLGLGASIGNADARPSFLPGDLREYHAFQDRVTGEERENGNGPNSFAKNGPLYYLALTPVYLAAPGGELLDRMLWMRLAGGAMYILIVLFTWLLAAELFRSSAPRFLAATVVALHPKLTNLAGTVNTDILLVLLWTAFAWAAVRAIRHGLTVRRAIVIGALAGASVLTHGRGLALVAPAMVAIALCVWRSQLPWRSYVRPVLAAGGTIFLCAVVGFWWTSGHSGNGAFGGEVTQAAGGGAGQGSLRQFISYVFQFYFGSFSFLQAGIGGGYGWRQGYIETWFSSLGSLEVVYKPQMFDYLQIAVAFGLAVLFAQVVWFRDLLARRWREIALLAAMCLSLIGLLHLASFRDLIGTNGVGILWTGRYLLPLVAIFGVAVAFVTTRLGRRGSAVAIGTVLGVGIVLQLSQLAMTVARFHG